MFLSSKIYSSLPLLHACNISSSYHLSCVFSVLFGPSDPLQQKSTTTFTYPPFQAVPRIGVDQPTSIVDHKKHVFVKCTQIHNAKPKCVIIRSTRTIADASDGNSKNADTDHPQAILSTRTEYSRGESAVIAGDLDVLIKFKERERWRTCGKDG